MQTLVLVVSRFQVSVVNRQYEKSRWSLVAAAVLLMIHYGLQMACGFRAHSDDAGTIVNILFYTPATFLVAHSILNLECEKRRRRRYDLLFGILFVITLVAFGSGWLTRNSLYMPYEQMVLHTLYLVSMLASIVIPLCEIHRNRSRVEAETGGDIMPYARYTWAGYLLFCCTSLALVGAIMWRPLLFIVGPAVLLSAVIFNMSFVAMGYNLAPIDEVLTDATMRPTPHSQRPMVTPMSQHQTMSSPSSCHPKWCVLLRPPLLHGVPKRTFATPPSTWSNSHRA